MIKFILGLIIGWLICSIFTWKAIPQKWKDEIREKLKEEYEK